MSRKHVGDPGMNMIFFLGIWGDKTVFGRLIYKKKWPLFTAACGAGSIKASSMQMDSPSDRVIWAGDKLSRVISKLYFREYCLVEN